MNNQSAGFTLFDAVLAIFLFSITAVMLIGFHSAFLTQYHLLQESQQSWRFAHQFLEVYPAENGVKLPQNWQHKIDLRSVDPNCDEVRINVISPLGKQAELSRWYCLPDAQ